MMQLYKTQLLFSPLSLINDLINFDYFRSSGDMKASQSNSHVASCGHVTYRLNYKSKHYSYSSYEIKREKERSRNITS